MILKDGYIQEVIDPKLDLVTAIRRLKQEKNAVILAHYYTIPEVQEIADFVGDSLALAQKAASTSADIILFAGVHFMAETAKVLSPEKKVLLPDLEAGCSLADSCPADEFSKFIAQHSGYKVVSYVNTSVAVKALTDVVCTSSNAVRVVNSLPEDQPIIFGPDKNLGNYIQSITGRKNMLIWDGACHVHEKFSVEKILELQKKHPQAKVLAHPECKREVLIVADFVGSTAALLEFSKYDAAPEYIIATESGILHQMVKDNPTKTFIAAPPSDAGCACNDCAFMKLMSLPKIYLTLKYEQPEVKVDPNLIERAKLPILRMLELSK